MTSIAAAIAGALHARDPAEKIRRTRAAARDWRLGRLDHVFDTAMPDRPGRPALPELLAPGRMPRRGKGGTEKGRIALLHALAHIEFVAMDLALDLPGRFGGEFPREFIGDWMKVAADEALHFALLDRRLRTLGSFYGALPAHDGLWEAATATAQDASARLAVVPMVLEARGLDVTPITIARFEQAGDLTSARILTRIMNDEIVHVSAGTKWFRWACARDESDPVATWKWLVNRHFGGTIKPPFNDSARSAAGLTQDYYR